MSEPADDPPRSSLELPEPYNIIQMGPDTPKMLHFNELCYQHGGFPSDSPLYTHPPTDAPAVFSTNFGEREYRTLRLPALPGIARSDPDRDIHEYSLVLKKKYPEVTDKMKLFTCLEDIHKYFDIHDIWYQGIGFLWEVCEKIAMENSWRNDEMIKRVKKWEDHNYERFTAHRVGTDVYDGLFGEADREFLVWEEWRDWDMEFLRKKLNDDRLALEPKLIAEREAAEAERIRQEAEAERIRQAEIEEALREAEAARIRAEEEYRAMEQQRLERERAEVEAARKAEALRREAAQAQNPAVGPSLWYPNNSRQMYPHSNIDHNGIYYPAHPTLSFTETQNLRFGPPHSLSRAGSSVQGQMMQPPFVYSPQDVRGAPQDLHQVPKRNASQPVYMHNSYGFQNEQAGRPPTAHGPNMPAMHQQGFPGGPFGREYQAAYSSGPRSQDGQSHFRDPNLQVFVGGFNNLTEAALRNVMSACGQVENIHFGKVWNPQGKNHAFVTYSDEESVEKAIEHFNGKVVRAGNETFRMQASYPRFCPKNPEFEASRYALNRSQFSRRSSNASQQHRRLPSNSSNYGVPGPVSQASGFGSQIPPLPIAQAPQGFPHPTVNIGDENVRPGHNQSPIKTANTPKAGANIEPLGVRPPNVRGDGLTINVPGPAMGSHLDEAPLSASSTAASSSAAVPVPEQNPDTSTPKKKKKKKKNNNKNLVSSSEPSHTGPHGSSILASGRTSRTLGSVNENPVAASENQSRKQQDGEFGQVIGVDMADASVLMYDDPSILRVKKTKAPEPPSSPRMGRSTSISGFLEEGTSAVRSSSMFYEDPDKEKLRDMFYRSHSASPSSRIPKTSEDMIIAVTSNEAETTEVVIETPTEAAAANTPSAATKKSNIIGTPKAVVKLSTEAVDREISHEKSDVIKTNNPVKLPLVALPLPAHKKGTSPPKGDIEKPRSMVKPSQSLRGAGIGSWADAVGRDTAASAKQSQGEGSMRHNELPKQPGGVNLSKKDVPQGSTKKNDLLKQSGSSGVKYSKKDVTQGSSKEDSSSKQSGGAKSSKKNQFQGSVKEDDTSKKPGNSSDKSSKKNLSHAVEETTATQTITEKSGQNKGKGRAIALDTADEKPRQDKGKGRATKPHIAEQQGESCTRVKNELEDSEVSGITVKNEETAVTETTVEADSNTTSAYEPFESFGPFEPTIEFTMPSQFSQRGSQGSQHHVRQNQSINSSSATMSSRADSKTFKQPAVTESLSIFGRKNKNKKKKKKENVVPAQMSITPTQLTDNLSNVAVVTEFSTDAQAVEQEMAHDDFDSASNIYSTSNVGSASNVYSTSNIDSVSNFDSASQIPLPDTPQPGTPKPTNTGAAKGRSLWGLLVDSVFHSNLGRTGVFGAIVVVFAVMMLGAMAGGGNVCIGVSNSHNGGGHRGGVGGSFHGSQSVSFVIHNARDLEGTIKED